MATTASKGRTAAAEAARCNALSEVLAESWWMVGLRGILGIIFGLICLFATDIALMSLILLFSAYLLVDGLFAIAAGIRNARNGERWGLLLLEGLVDIAAAAVAFLWPGLTLVVLIWIIAIWAVISGGLMLASAFALKKDHGRWWLALGGICSLIFGALLIVAPLVGAFVLIWWLGAYALVFGVVLLVLDFQLHSKYEARPAPRAKRA
ncbi:MAG: HdeD family acid-resistance protein [Methyloceanibacter sp.]|nr:HdeD family acid-resistance protein [Methyloceanibacter sp.]